VELGFDVVRASLMADDSRVDLAQARKLVALGCPLGDGITHPPLASVYVADTRSVAELQKFQEATLRTTRYAWRRGSNYVCRTY
jgi:hypothetical protein